MNHRRVDVTASKNPPRRRAILLCAFFATLFARRAHVSSLVCSPHRAVLNPVRPSERKHDSRVNVAAVRSFGSIPLLPSVFVFFFFIYVSCVASLAHHHGKSSEQQHRRRRQACRSRCAGCPHCHDAAAAADGRGVVVGVNVVGALAQRVHRLECVGFLVWKPCRRFAVVVSAGVGCAARPR